METRTTISGNILTFTNANGFVVVILGYSLVLVLRLTRIINPVVSLDGLQSPLS